MSDNRETVDRVFNRILKEMDWDAGSQAIKIIVEEWGGVHLHIPSKRTLVIEARDFAIRASYKDGYSYEALACAHDLTPRAIRQIIHEKGG
jgi:Mor family transcriptional regulator